MGNIYLLACVFPLSHGVCTNRLPAIQLEASDFGIQ
ncbi:hypothetical protein NFI96_034292, partial [Prochilodus magdalenae]